MEQGMIISGIIMAVIHLIICLLSTAEIDFFDLVVAFILFICGYYSAIIYFPCLVGIYVLGRKSNI